MDDEPARQDATDAEAICETVGRANMRFVEHRDQTVISRGFYALGSTWLPTSVGTTVAFCAVPLYVLLRQE